MGGGKELVTADCVWMMNTCVSTLLKVNCEKESDKISVMIKFIWKSHALMYLYSSVVLVLNHVRLSASPLTVTCQASLSMEFFRQEHWSGLTFSPPGNLPDPGIEPMSPGFPALAGRFFYH
ncbi:unnamed protein product [Rangifer tarandus platyrhynchus]|uniref:Uncharacterized protein n=1 Tax=Rangifer tarandus platyrhynchus TaxID=3082113 RepID=A0AC59ZCS7_RANTA